MLRAAVPLLAFLSLACALGEPSAEEPASDTPVDGYPREGDDAGECADGADNDGDGDFDCADAGCGGSPDCADTDADTDTDADADTDADTDTDTDTDADTDTDTDTGSTEACELFQGKWLGDGFLVTYESGEEEWRATDITWEFYGDNYRTDYSIGSETTGFFQCNWQDQILYLSVGENYYDFAFEGADTFSWVKNAIPQTSGTLYRSP